MTHSTRDNTLDYLKGIACVLMIFAHAAGTPKSFILIFLRFVGDFAPVIFFAVAGITASLQSKKYSLLSIAISYACLFILGISDSYAQIYRFGMGILQIIAIGCFGVTVAEKLNNKNIYGYLIISIIIFSISLTFKSILLEGSMYSLLIPIGRVGVFPVFPWLSFFFLGVFAYKVDNRLNIVFSILSLVLIAVCYWSGITLGLTAKWQMLPGYYLISVFVLFSVFFIARLSNLLFLRKARILLFFGQNSLLFFYVHFFFARIFNHLLAENMVAIWITVAIATFVSMKLLLILSKHDRLKERSENIGIWLIIMMLTVLIPLYFNNEVIIYISELALGIFFSLYYPILNKIIKKKINT